MPYLFARTTALRYTKSLEDEPLGVDSIDDKQAIVTLGFKGAQIVNLTTLTPGRVIIPESLLLPTKYCNVSCRDGQIWISKTNLMKTIWNALWSPFGEKATLIQIDIRGNVIREVTAQFSPMCICLSPAGVIYYCNAAIPETGNYNMHCITPNGHATIFDSPPDLRTPSEIAVDATGNVYIVREDSNNIHKMSSNGKRNTIILTKEDGIRNPCCLCSNKYTNPLLVVNDHGRRIDVYRFD